ncbi:substrate-binding domain-containing protein [Kitasatospora xanthocidica]|uniref:substrate-binding domain-containing protein n=1 Tax=Kitasatospora xanthocidica TaxID=83382 RepID=UPI00216B3FEE|nr:substrate-binding domain-containing protein [Kitasatospora xanthocidica]
MGERLIPILAELVQHADRVIAEAAAHFSEVFRFGNAEWTPPSLRSALKSALPVKEVQTETLSPDTAIAQVSRGALHAAMVPGVALAASAEADEPALASTVIVREPVWVALPHDHHLVGQEAVSPAQLASLRWVRYTRDHWFHPIEKQLFAAVGRADLEVLHYVDGHHEAMNWVRDVRAAALTPPTGVTREVRLVPVSVAEGTDMLLVWRSDSVTDDIQRRLLTTLRRYYCEYARTIPGYWSWVIRHPDQFAELESFLPPRVQWGGAGRAGPEWSGPGAGHRVASASAGGVRRAAPVAETLARAVSAPTNPTIER